MTSNDPQDLRIDATKNFVDILGKKDTYSVVKFEDSAELVVERTFEKEGVENLEENFNSSGGTNISSGLEEGIKILDNGDTKSRVIVLLTDGEDSGLTSKREEIIRQAVRKDIVIFTIFLNTGYNTNSNNTHDIEEIAKATGGEFYTINSDDLINIFKQISKVTIGVDGKKDTDRDGIPDEIELGGMKSKQAQIIYTNPFDRDTDRDGILDNDEIGEISEDENGVQFYNMVSDPSIPNGAIKEYKTVLGPSPDADPADVWATDFKFNKNAFRFENISVLENGGICAGIGYAIEHFYNGEEVYDNYNYNGEHFEFKLDDDELDILSKEKLGLAYFYYPTTDELKSFTDKSIFNNQNNKMTQEYIDKKQADNKLIRFLYYMWLYENAIKIQNFYEGNDILPAIDQNKSVTEDTIDKLKILFDHDKIVVVRVPKHVVNGYALEKISETQYRLYIYDNTAPYVKEKNCYIDLKKKKDKDEYKVEYHLGVGISNTTADHMVLFKYNDKFLNFTREVLAISE